MAVSSYPTWYRRQLGSAAATGCAHLFQRAAQTLGWYDNHKKEDNDSNAAQRFEGSVVAIWSCRNAAYPSVPSQRQGRSD
ncbi:hypothetical protein SNOG_06961 [Parastagonospora nodorum SN15]|uniref:Uncharacterized protein n=1 Tax=Phaeosphaeria nodorum (strain SN15 / ATCC MYA-4574 / FGSC 10173) TaxID=321614 RepID=Q0UMQ3_PHANO|nr:hypothetical protein SNOG_06961 [Parastagonospora nodorum SN15]EAT85612.1 hypothetical protein SNOG_06961 [Parastagonospora nodorum SN15]